MSADNGVYITQWNDGFRVAHAQAIENIDYYQVGSPEWEQSQLDYFGSSPLFANELDAIIYAHALEKKILSDDFCPILEYGVCIIPDNRGKFPVPTDSDEDSIEREERIRMTKKFSPPEKIIPCEEHSLACISRRCGLDTLIYIDIEFCSHYERAEQTNPEIVVCRQESETLEDFVKRTKKTATWMAS